jgi:hypothetical protein
MPKAVYHLKFIPQISGRVFSVPGKTGNTKRRGIKPHGVLSDYGALKTPPASEAFY